MEIPCVGNNGIYIEEKGGRAGPFCAKKKMPAFVSRDVFFDIHIIVDTPLEVSFLLLNFRFMNFRSCQFQNTFPLTKVPTLIETISCQLHYPYINPYEFQLAAGENIKQMIYSLPFSLHNEQLAENKPKASYKKC